MAKLKLEKLVDSLSWVVIDLYKRVIALEDINKERTLRYKKISKKLDSAFDMVQSNRGGISYKKKSPVVEERRIGNGLFGREHK